MGILLNESRVFKDIIYQSFENGETPQECAGKLVQAGFYPPPTEDELKEGSVFLETVKQVLLDEFYDTDNVKSLAAYGDYIRKWTKGEMTIIAPAPKTVEPLLQWLPMANLKVLKGKLRYRFGQKDS